MIELRFHLESVNLNYLGILEEESGREREEEVCPLRGTFIPFTYLSRPPFLQSP